MSDSFKLWWMYVPLSRNFYAIRESIISKTSLSHHNSIRTLFIAVPVATNVFIPIGFNPNTETLYRFHLESQKKLLLEVMV